MHIIEVTARHRNDFHFRAQCRHGKAVSSWGDGYADAFYQEKVFPARHCPECGLNEHGEIIAIASLPTETGPETMEMLGSAPLHVAGGLA